MTEMTATTTAMTQRLDEVVDKALDTAQLVGTVVLVARDGALVYRRAAGFADREAARPMTEDAIFRLASITKPYVTAAAMRLIEDGTLALDTPMARWLPDFQPRLPDGTVPTITIRHLLTHQSGLSYRFLELPDSPYHRLDISDGLDQPGLSIAENLARLAQIPLAFPPGNAWRYSLALDVLGVIMERATGVPLPDLVARLVTHPLAMADTVFHATDRARLVTPYADSRQGAPIPMTDGISVPLGVVAARFAPSRLFDPASYPSGGSGMAGTAGDTLTFLETIRQGGAPILQPETVAEMTRSQVGLAAETQGPGWGFGYGWAVLDNPLTASTPQAKGTFQWGGAYGHSWFVDPIAKLTVVALTNTAFAGMTGPWPLAVRNAVYG